MQKWKKLGKEQEDFLSFPVLLALSRRPMATRELAYTLQMGQQQVKERCEALEDAGWVVRRARDGRYVMVVRLVAASIPEPSGVPGITPGAAELPVIDRMLPGNTILTPVNAPGNEQGVGGGSVVAGSQPEGSERILSVAERLAEMMDVPVLIETWGSANVGNITGCAGCGKPTPLRYGSRSTCPKCARVWSCVGAIKEENHV